MSVPLPRSRALWLVLALVFAVLGAVVPSAMAHQRGVLYTQTNDPAGNAVQRFDRAADGSLSPAGTFATGGAGLATLGGRQGAVALSGDGATSTRSTPAPDSVSAFRVGRHRTVLLGSVALGRRRARQRRRGPRPRLRPQLRRHPERAAFWRRFDGSLKAIPGGTRELAPGADGAAQVSVTPDGRSLVVTERLANRLETLPLDRLGRPGAPVVTPSSGAVPFGFAITRRGDVVVSEAGASTVSSYRTARRRAAHHHRLAAGRLRRGVLGRGLARRAPRLHRQRQRQHQRLRGRA